MLPWLPENVSTFGGAVDSLTYLIFYITTIVFLLVQTALVVFLIRYRARPGRSAVYTHGNNTLEVAWTIAPSLILVVLALLSQSTWREMKQELPPSKVHVQVTAKQFNWDFLYPGPDGKFGTEDDLTLENELHVPVDEVVRLTLKARDVIHSFFVPQLRLKQDMLPGREIPAWFEATKPGRYEIPCAELCGFGHSGMLGHLTVHSKEDYAAWLEERWPGSPPAELSGVAPTDEEVSS
jgi:cytochrome c oxidase subunit 2